MSNGREGGLSTPNPIGRLLVQGKHDKALGSTGLCCVAGLTQENLTPSHCCPPCVAIYIYFFHSEPSQLTRQASGLLSRDHTTISI